MKIRIQNNTLRLRFSQSELKALFDNGAIRQDVSFPGGTKLTYSLVKSDNSIPLSAEYIQNEIKVKISSAKVNELIITDLVGVEGKHAELEILVEKDFKCLTERKEDESDLFTNPQKSHAKN